MFFSTPHALSAALYVKRKKVKKFYNFPALELLLLLVLSSINTVQCAVLFSNDLSHYWTLIIPVLMQPVAFSTRQERGLVE